MTHEAPTPSDILNVIRCKCKTSCGLNSKCSSCRASGLKCVVSCRDCRETECMNISEIVSNDNDGHEKFESDDENNVRMYIWIMMIIHSQNLSITL